MLPLDTPTISASTWKLSTRSGSLRTRRKHPNRRAGLPILAGGFLQRGSTTQDLADFLRKQGRRKRLLQKRQSFFEHPAAGDNVLRVARHVQHANSLPPRSDPRRQFPPACTRHHHVCKQKVDFMREFGSDLFGMRRMARHDDLISPLRKKSDNQVANCLFVLHQQNRLRSSLVFQLRKRRGALLDLLSHSRQVHFEGTPFSGFAVDPDVSAALLHDAVNGRKSKPGSSSALLCGVKRLKNVRQRLLVHSDAGVRDRKHYVAT